MIRIVFSCLFLLISVHVFSQDASGTVTFYMTEGDNTELLWDYTVKLTAPSISIVLYHKYFSDYRIDGLTPATYTIRIEKKGYHIAEMTNVPVIDKNIIGLHFKLKKRNFGEKRKIFSEERRELIVDPENK